MSLIHFSKNNYILVVKKIMPLCSNPQMNMELGCCDLHIFMLLFVFWFIYLCFNNCIGYIARHDNYE
jgi:hypothetical protein